MTVLNLNQLRVFHAVATLKSFTRAADAVHLTQPGISKHIKELEEYYGVRLFERRARSIALTQAGEILLAATQQITVCLEKAERQLKELGNAPSRLALAATFTVGLHILPSRLAVFRQQHPQIEATLDIFPAKMIEEKLLKDSFDVGLVGHKINNRSLVTVEFFSDELVVIVPPQHPWASRNRKVRPEELRKESFVATATDSGTRLVVEERLRRNGVKLTKVADFGNMEAVKRAVEAGLGVSVLSQSVIQRELSAGLLRMLPVAGREMYRKFFLVHRKERYLSPAAHVFIESLSLTQRQ
ncbi:LysR family transcriptional regulator [Alloacidobacterium dinghuense]|uniref:LysR family transcriptional regulator n=1 Tax=Alloacidobacterium dinghuense TaxID=2763107 RepID=A0A7G8BQJ5_9BACT|nr:LysR family transcriptional regulator [Alloacidobacterium dinghuense]